MSERTQRTASDTCIRGALGMDDRPGHTPTLMRLRLAAATPRGWADAVVTAVHEDGRIELADWRTGTASTLWQHADVRDLLGPGDVVAHHAAYGVLAAGSHRLSVA